MQISATAAALAAFVGLAAVSITTSSAALAADAQEDRELLDLSIEELLAAEVRKIGVLGAHTHYAGQWMLGYHYMAMQMGGNRSGTDRLDADDVLAGFMVSPTEMFMQMHMIHLMYAPSDVVTLMLMLPIHDIEMDHVTRSGARFTTRSTGIGDLEAEAIVTLHDDERHHVFVSGGLSLPTGSINERGTTPMGPSQKLPYPMQLGSGTYDVVLSAAYTGREGPWGWGAQTKGKIRTGENSDDYRLGDRVVLSAWGLREITDWLGASLRLDYTSWGDIRGADPELNPAMVPTADPDLRGGKRLDLLAGATTYVGGPGAGRHRVGVEGGVPIYQSLDGPQLEVDWLLNLDWTVSF